MLQVSELVKLIAHKVDSSDQGAMSGIGIVNEAGRFLCSLRPWNFQLRPEGILALVNTQPYCALPADFARLAGQPMPNRLATRARWMQMTTYETVLKLRGTQPGSGSADGDYIGSLVSKGPATSGPPTFRIEIWPTPTADDANAFTLPYFAKWVDALVDSDYVNLPDFAEGLMRHLVREVAAGYENDDEKSVWDRQDAIISSSLFQAVVSADSSLQVNLGPLQGGAADAALATRQSGNAYKTFYPVQIT